MRTLESWTTSLRRSGAVRFVVARWIPIAGWVCVAGFLWMVGRYWHPYYGFTKFIQMDAGSARIGIPEVRRNHLYVFHEYGGYDGLSYAQLAYHPLLDSPGLDTALDNPGFRARRILLSGVVWLLAGGRESRIAGVYSAFNIGLWLVFAFLLWGWLPVRDGRSWLAWAGFMFSAGALFSVHFALTDLFAVFLIAIAVRAWERGGTKSGAGWLALATLARETSMISAVSGWIGRFAEARSWWKNALLGVAVAGPLAIWMMYVRHRFGARDAGFGNFDWPLVDWWWKWGAIVRSYGNPSFHWLTITTLLATVAFTVQAVFFVIFRRPDDRWWRLGAINVVMMLFLSRAVWEGDPGSFTRVLLPMSLAFAVCAVRWRVPLAWLLVGNLTVCAGVQPFTAVYRNGDDLGAGRVAGEACVALLKDGWTGVAVSQGRILTWCGNRGMVEIKSDGVLRGRLRVSLQLRAITPREVDIRAAGRVVWSGRVPARWQTVAFEWESDESHPLVLEFSSPAQATADERNPGARPVSFGVRDFMIEASTLR